MTKLEKVFKGLECCIEEPEMNEDCVGLECPYRNGNEHCMTELHKDALEVCKAFDMMAECIKKEVKPYMVR